MTLVDEIDYEVEQAPAVAPIQPLLRQGWWPVATFVAGALLAIGVVALPRQHSAIAAPVQREISFLVGGNVAASSGVVLTRSGQHEQGSTTATYDSPTAAVLTVISTKNGEAMCRITVNRTVVQRTAENGASAVCVWSAAV